MRFRLLRPRRISENSITQDQSQITDEILRKSDRPQHLLMFECVAADDPDLVLGHVEFLQLRLLLQVRQISQFIAGQVDHFRFDRTRSNADVNINQFNAIAGKQNEQTRRQSSHLSSDKSTGKARAAKTTPNDSG